jgi:crotonobetaine/carnitine-CoA ligase
MQGYIGMPEKTLEAWRNLWFQTGDCGYVDSQGYHYYTDRLTDRIRRRAENVSAYDIESVAMTIGGVADCAAIGVASEFENDDDIKLCLVLDVGARVAPYEVIRILAARLPHYMVPRYIEYFDALPRTPTNKVKKTLLRQQGITSGTWDRKDSGHSLREIASESGKRA